MLLCHAPWGRWLLTVLKDEGLCGGATPASEFLMGQAQEGHRQPEGRGSLPLGGHPQGAAPEHEDHAAGDPRAGSTATPTAAKNIAISSLALRRGFGRSILLDIGAKMNVLEED